MRADESNDPAPALLRSGSASGPRTLVDIFDESVGEHPDAPAVDNGAVVLTYTEMAEAAEEVAAALQAWGVGRGSRLRKPTHW